MTQHAVEGVKDSEELGHDAQGGNAGMQAHVLGGAGVCDEAPLQADAAECDDCRGGVTKCACVMRMAGIL